MQAGRRALELAKDDATFEALKAGGATMSDMTQQKKNDLLLEYVKKGVAGGALMALQAGADVNHKDKISWTALLWAAEKGHEALAQGRTSTRQTGREHAAPLGRIEQQARGCQGAVGERGPSQCARQIRSHSVGSGHGLWPCVCVLWRLLGDKGAASAARR